MKFLSILIFAICAMFFLTSSCKKESEMPQPTSPSSEVIPIDINTQNKGFDLLEKMKGHWIGSNKVLGWDWEWFAFDYRPISPSHIFGIYEGGTLGNLLTSFFVADYKGKRTIMARNGGVLSGIYRTSYFVLDSIHSENGADYYRLVDAIGGANTMYMELSFKGDSLHWKAYTSRMGQNPTPTKHFDFKGKKEHLQLANTAATAVNFPQNIPAWDFSQGFNTDYLYVIPNQNQAKSATFLAQAKDNSHVFDLAIESGDPFKIQDHPYLATLQVNIDKNTEIQEDKLFVYLSFEPLTDSNGYMVNEGFNSVLQFPDISASKDQFLFTYLHPGEYYITVIADHNQDGIPGEGDITHVSQSITIAPNSENQVTITNINIQN